MSIRLQLFKVKCSRFVRSTTNAIKKRFSGSTAGSPDNIFGEDIRPLREVNREKRAKTTAVVVAAGSAIGISHLVAANAKYGACITPKCILAGGVAVGATLGAVWYKKVDAAEDDISEEDIEAVIDLVSSASVQYDIKYSSDGIKAIDIIHTMVTGREVEYAQDKGDGRTAGKLKFKYIEDEDDEDYNRTGVRSSNNAFTQRASFSSTEDEDEDDKPFRSNIFSTGSISKGKSLFKEKSYVRQSFIPSMDREDDLPSNQDKEEWLDI